MTDDLVKRLRMDIEPSEGDMKAAADRIEALETFVHAIAWGPPHIIEYNTYINGLVAKAQALCPKREEKTYGI